MNRNGIPWGIFGGFGFTEEISPSSDALWSFWLEPLPPGRDGGKHGLVEADSQNSYPTSGEPHCVCVHTHIHACPRIVYVCVCTHTCPHTMCVCPYTVHVYSCMSPFLARKDILLSYKIKELHEWTYNTKCQLLVLVTREWAPFQLQEEKRKLKPCKE